MPNETGRLRLPPVRSRTRPAPKAALPDDEQNSPQPANRAAREEPPAPSRQPSSERHDDPSSKAQGYEVGYAKPPLHTQFKPGQSGNPNGRPKRALSLNTIVRKRLIEPVQIKTASGIKRVSRIEALLMKAIDEGGRGQLRAIERLFAMYAAAVPEPRHDPGAPEPTNSAELSAADEAIVGLLRAEIAAELLPKKPDATIESPGNGDENA